MALEPRVHAGLTILALIASFSAHAMPAADRVETNLDAQIAAASRNPERFAVDVAHIASIDMKGEWTSDATSAKWRYIVQVPGATSLSFHATRFELPPSATLTVRAGDDTYVYRVSDLHGTTLWSRIARGDTLDFELDVAAADRPEVAFEIGSLQVGFRDLDNARWKAQALTAPSNSSCVQNYACSVSDANAGPGRASVAAFVRNVGACSGTLLNNATGDNTPYILTARHCQSPTSSAKALAPEDLSVYWNAVTPCGQTIGSVYSSDAVVQVGLTTIVEQQDLWLLLLDQSPLVSDAYFAGFDATGASVVGGYTIHHGASRTKQLVSWFGQAFAASGVFSSLGGKYTSHFWETVNAQGNIAPGASGSALFDRNNRVVGALSLGSATTDDSGWDQCPAASPPAPDGQNSAGYFTQLAAAWNSSADTSSSTGSRTLKSVLDPKNSGALIVDGVAASSGLSFTGSAHSLQTTQTLTLDWNAPGATSCMATGGAGSDPWPGSVATQGSKQIREDKDGVVTYSLTCTLAGGRVATARVVVTWSMPPATAYLNADRMEAWATRPVTLTWSSNRTPCTITGGSTSLRNLASSGTTTVTEASPTQVTYLLTCGSAQAMQGLVKYTQPSVQFTQKASERRPGVFNTLSWQSGAESCTSSGGAPNEGWAGYTRATQGSFTAVSGTIGTFTYTLTCKAGALSAQASVTSTVKDVAAYATLTTSTTTVDVNQDVTVSWKSNVAACSPRSDDQAIAPMTGTTDEGSGTVRFDAAGTHTLSFKCGSVEATPVTLTVRGVSTPPADPVVAPATGSTAANTSGSGGGGALNWLSLLGLALFAARRVRRHSTTSL